MTEAEFEAIRERVEAATPGPWVTCGCDHPTHENDCPYRHRNEIVGYVYHKHIGWAVFTEADLDPYRSQTGVFGDPEFIAHARQDVPALLAEIDCLRGDLKDLLAGPVDRGWAAQVQDILDGTYQRSET